MPAPLLVPVGELSTLGVGKEGTAGTFTVPTLWHAIEKWTPTSKNAFQPRGGARGRRGQNLPIVTAYDFKGVITPEADPDAIGQLFALGMGGQTVASAIYINTTSVNAITIATPATITPVNIVGVSVGQSIAIGGASPETVVVIAVNLAAGTFTANTTATHLAGVSLIATSGSAKQNTLIFGNQPTFSTELNYGPVAVDYLGCIVESFTASIQKGKGLAASFNVLAMNEVTNGAPTTPSFSTKMPPAFENNLNWASFAGQNLASGGVTLHGVDFTVNNNIDPNYRPFGSRFVNQWPQQQRKVTVKLSLGFESDYIRSKFYGGATTPTSSVLGQSLDVRICTQDLADVAMNAPYAFEFLCANAFISQMSQPVDAGKLIMQDFMLECAESANQANDDILIRLTNLNAAIF